MPVKTCIEFIKECEKYEKMIEDINNYNNQREHGSNNNNDLNKSINPLDKIRTRI